MPPTRRGRSCRAAAPGSAVALTVLSGCAFLTGCIGAAGRPILPPPSGAAGARAAGFPARVDDRDVWLEARLPTDHVRVLGVDLTRRGLLPVEVRIGRRPGGAAGLYLDAAGPAAELVLQDGTVLPGVPDPRPSRADERLLAALAETRLERSLLPAWEDARAGLLFFRLDPDRVRVRGTRALSNVPGAERELDLLASLLRLEVHTSEGARTLHVGLRAGRWEGE